MFYNLKQPIDFLGKRRIAIGLSILSIVIGIISIIAHKGLRYGVDFVGGTNVQIKFSKKIPLELVRSTLQSHVKEFTLQSFGDDHHFEVLVTLPVNSALGAGEVLVENLKVYLDSVDPQLEIRRVESVGPKAGKELKTNALLAIAVSLALILIYVSFRFHWEFALGAVLALAHDSFILVAAFSLMDKEFTLNILAAILTLVGYSLNDTIVVFDRIRETSGRFREMPMEKIMNISITDTLSRTILTSLTVLFVVLVLLFFGGEIVHDFALAMVIGVVAGTFSSIYVASPLVLWITNYSERRALAKVNEAKAKAKVNETKA